MKTYRYLKEDIGLSTGVGLAGIDMPLGIPPQKRRFNGYNNDVMLGIKLHKFFESMGICETHMEPMVYKDGRLTCEMCISEE